MNRDISGNNLMRRSSLNHDMDNRRFHLNQYYNAVEDEQIYNDEYTTLIHRYNDFIVSGNTMFSRMEQTLRDNLTRVISRQTYHHQQYSHENVRNGGGGGGVPSPFIFSYTPPAPAPAPATAPAPAPDPAPASIAAPAANPPPIRSNSYQDSFQRLLSRYITSDIARETRQPIINNTRNLFSMLYTFPIPGLVNTGNGDVNRQAPTNDQIEIATLNTVFGNIISPVNATCPISRDEFNDESEITMIRGCKHIFNRDSLRQWFVSHPTCPMCRQDIRGYRPSPPSPPPPPPPPPPSSYLPQPSSIPPLQNVSIDSMDNEHITFSYDIPPISNYSEDQIYRDIVNTIVGMTTRNTGNGTTGDRSGQGDHHDHDDDDDIMEVD
jgi:hypothetical protein